MDKSKTRPLTLLLIPAVLCLFVSVAVNAQQGPDLFSYGELVQLYEQETPPDALQNKLNRLLTTPFVSNAATARGVKPLVPMTPKLEKVSAKPASWFFRRRLGVKCDEEGA
jgi:hypothetical protein